MMDGTRIATFMTIRLDVFHLAKPIAGSFLGTFQS